MNDEQLIAEAYTRIYQESDSDFREQMPSSAKVHEPEAEHKELQKQLQDKSWVEQYVSIGNQARAHVGINNGRVYVVWDDRYSDGDRYYYDYFVVYKDEGKHHEIEEDQYDRLVDLALHQQ